MGGSAGTTLWQVDNCINQGDKVVATGSHGFRCKKTGEDALLNWAMVWNFENVEPVSGRSYYNTADSENAFK